MKKYWSILVVIIVAIIIATVITHQRNDVNLTRTVDVNVEDETEKLITEDTLENVEDEEVVIGENDEEVSSMKMTINGTEVSVAWEDNDSVKEIMGAAPLTIEMSMYGGWEQVGSLGRSFTRNDVQQTAESGDIMLYSGNQLVVFYGSNSWAYTKLGKIQGLSEDEITDLLSNGDVTITITK